MTDFFAFRIFFSVLNLLGHLVKLITNIFFLSGPIKVREKKAKGQRKAKSNLKQLHQEKVNQFRNLHRIHVKGSDIPEPIESWDRFHDCYGVTQDVLQILKDCYPTPTPVQMQAVSLMLERRETLVCAPTGSGNHSV